MSFCFYLNGLPLSCFFHSTQDEKQNQWQTLSRTQNSPSLPIAKCFRVKPIMLGCLLPQGYFSHSPYISTPVHHPCSNSNLGFSGISTIMHGAGVVRCITNFQICRARGALALLGQGFLYCSLLKDQHLKHCPYNPVQLNELILAPYSQQFTGRGVCFLALWCKGSFARMNGAKQHILQVFLQTGFSALSKTSPVSVPCWPLCSSQIVSWVREAPFLPMLGSLPPPAAA